MSSDEVLMSVGNIVSLTGIIVGRRLKQQPTSREDALAELQAAAASAGIDNVERFLVDPYPVASEQLHQEVVRLRAAAAQHVARPAPTKARKASAPRPAAKVKPKGAAPARKVKPPDQLARGPTKREIILEMVLSPAGATEQEICARIGWAACMTTLRRAAAAADVTLRGERTKGQPTRWYGTRP